MKMSSSCRGLFAASVLCGFAACTTNVEEPTSSSSDPLTSCPTCPTSCDGLTYTTSKECSEEAVDVAESAVDFLEQSVAAHDHNAAQFDAAAADEDAYYEVLKGLVAKSLQAEMTLQEVIQSGVETACEKVEHTSAVEVVAALAASTNPYTEGAWAAYEIYKEGHAAKNAAIYTLKQMPHVTVTVASSVVECAVWQRGSQVKPIALDKILNKTTTEFAHKSLPIVGVAITALQIGASISECNKAIDATQTGALAQEASALAAQTNALVAQRNAAKAAADAFRASAASERAASATASQSLDTARADLTKARADLKTCTDAVAAADTTATAPVCNVDPDAGCDKDAGDGGKDGGDAGDAGKDAGDAGKDAGDGGTDASDGGKDTGAG